MFTIKFYSSDGFRQRILAAESFTILRSSPLKFGDDGSAEITLHGCKDGDCRYDIKDDGNGQCGYSGPPRFQKAIIENSAGRTTEIISLRPSTGVATTSESDKNL